MNFLVCKLNHNKVNILFILITECFGTSLNLVPGGKYLTCLTLVQALGDGIHLDFYRKPLKCLKQGMVRFAYWTCGFAAEWRMVSNDGQCQRQGPIWEVAVRASLLTHECSTGYVYGELVRGGNE